MSRIAFVSDVAYPWVHGGVQSIEYKEMRELSKRHDVYSFSLMFEGMKPSFTREGIHYIAFRKTNASEIYANGKRSMALARSFATGIGNALHGKTFDLVVANSFPYLHLAAVKRHCRKTGAKLALDVAEVWDLDYWKRYLGAVKGRLAYMYMKNALKGADAYMANSSTTAKRLEAAGIDRKKIRVFSPVFDAAQMKGVKAGMTKNRIVYVGRLVKEKRLDLLIRVAKNAAKLYPAIKVLIVGSGPEEEAVRAAAARAGLSKVVGIMPSVKEDEKVYRIVKESKALINMSEREGLSAVAIEALALGTPVLLPSYTPIPEEVKRMCVVRDIDDIPMAMAQIAKTKRKARFIRHAGGLAQFRVSRVNAFYSKLIDEMERARYR